MHTGYYAAVFDHPHIHFVVPAGGLAADGSWRATRPGFFLPVRALSVRFARKLGDLLNQAGLGGTIDRAVWKRPWVVHVQPAGDGRPALRYLARYVFRVALSNSRMVSCDHGRVVFRYQKLGSRHWSTMNLHALEFMRRFLQHVLPRGFQKVRRYGFLSPASKASIVEVRRRVEDSTFETTLTAVAIAATPAVPRPVTCPHCGGVMLLECLVLPGGKRLVPRSALPQRRVEAAVDPP